MQSLLLNRSKALHLQRVAASGAVPHEIGVADRSVVAVLGGRVGWSDADVDLIVAVPADTTRAQFQAFMGHLEEEVRWESLTSPYHGKL